MARLNNALRRLGGGWSLFVEARREAAAGYPSASWPNAAAWLVDVERAEAFQRAGARFESAYYLTFVWNPPPAPGRRVEALFYTDPAGTIRSDLVLRDLAQFRNPPSLTSPDVEEAH